MGTTSDYCTYIKAALTPYFRAITVGGLELSNGKRGLPDSAAEKAMTPRICSTCTYRLLHNPGQQIHMSDPLPDKVRSIPCLHPMFERPSLVDTGKLSHS